MAGSARCSRNQSLPHYTDIMSCSKKTLPPKLLKKAQLELNEDQATTSLEIQSFREKILEDPNHNFRTDDAFLLKFLRARKFDQNRALELIINYYKQREIYPDLFKTTRVQLDNVLSYHMGGFLLQRDSNGRAVMIQIIERWDTSQVSYEELIYSFVLHLEVISEDEDVNINGMVIIIDLQGLTLGHVAAMTPSKMKEAVNVLLNCFPMRIKMIHFVNESPLFDGLFSFLKSFMNKKIQERITFHGSSFASLHVHVNAEVLPEELGGDNDPFDFTEWNKRVIVFTEVMSENLTKYGFVKSENAKLRDEH